MDMQFEKTILSCLEPVVREVQNAEQTQEIKLPDSLPDIGQVLSAWGQPILRSKEWRRDSISCAAGMMVWVLYLPEDGSAEQCMEGWIPFQMKWELPEDAAQGDLRIRLLCRFVDARSVSPRKILVRAGLGAMAEAYVPKSAALYQPDAVSENVQLLQQQYPARLPVEAGEKTFVLEEKLTLPASAPKIQQVLYHTLSPKVTDQKVLADKVVFRGNANLHLLYRSSEGQLHTWDFPLSFSQYAQMQTDRGADAQVDMVLNPTSVELETDGEGALHYKAGIVAQYLTTDRMLLDVVKDAYSLERELQIQTEPLELPVLLENRTENMFAEQTIPAQANLVADVQVLPDFPLQRRTAQGVEMEFPGTVQVLYYGEDGVLRSATARFENQQTIPADDNSQLTVLPQLPEQLQTVLGNGNIIARSELPINLLTTSREGIPMVTGLGMGQQRQPDANRPSLILQRAGENGLWDIAKDSGSTVRAIQEANKLQGEPAPGQMLLIPVMR